MKISKEEYQKIYHRDYAKYKKEGITFKFNKTKNGWHKIYYKNTERIGYEYSDVLYGKRVLINTLTKEGYSDLISVLNKTVTYNSSCFIITGYSSADLCQFQYKVILEKIDKFMPEKKNGIHTFMCECLHNAIINEGKRFYKYKRCPRVPGAKDMIAPTYSINDGNIDVFSKFLNNDGGMKEARRRIDLNKILRNEDEETIKLVLALYYANSSIRQAATDENIPLNVAMRKIAKLRKNKRLIDFLK